MAVCRASLLLFDMSFGFISYLFYPFQPVDSAVKLFADVWDAFHPVSSFVALLLPRPADCIREVMLSFQLWSSRTHRLDLGPCQKQTDDNSVGLCWRNEKVSGQSPVAKEE